MWFVGCALLMVVVTVVAPGGASLPATLGVALDVVGIALVALGIALNGRATQAFRAHDTPIDPTEAPRALVEDGPYRRTRNPMYVAGVMILLGIALLSGVALTAPVLLLYVLLVARAFVPADERTMERLFGDAWRDYASRVPRWL